MIRRKFGCCSRRSCERNFRFRIIISLRHGSPLYVNLRHDLLLLVVAPESLVRDLLCPHVDVLDVADLLRDLGALWLGPQSGDESCLVPTGLVRDEVAVLLRLVD